MTETYGILLNYDKQNITNVNITTVPLINTVLMV